MLRDRSRISSAVLVALLGAWAGRAFAHVEVPDSPVPINIKISRGPLIEAIKQLSEQAGIQITADWAPDGIENLPVDEIQESLTPDAVLSRLLDGTGLVARWHSPKTVRIVPVVAPHGYGNVNEVLVTGSRISDAGEGPAPVRVYTREHIDRLGVSSVAGVAGYFTQQPFSFGEWAQRTGAQHFQMRGLGVDTTLVLINGRRAPPSATSVTLNAFDLNTIPLTAVDRIEVMSDSASAIYGADAIGGVVNIILKKEVESPEVYLHYGDAAGGARERRAAMSVGSTGERLKTALTVDYFERGMLVGAKRDFWRNQDFRRFGGTDWRVATANPGNVYSLTGEPLPGLQNSFASVPAGSTGVGLTPEDFRATDGVLSLDSSLATATFLPRVNRLAAFGSAELSLSDRSELFGEVLVARSDVLSQGSLPFVSRQVVSSDNPYNPFGEPVAVDFRLMGMKPVSYVAESELTRIVLGSRGEVGNWDWELVLTGGDERSGFARVNDVDVARVQVTLDATEWEAALNPFADGPAGPDDLLTSLVGSPQEIHSYFGGWQISGFLRGELFQLPGGMGEFVVGGEWRRDDVELIDFYSARRRRAVTAGFTEAKFPLLRSFAVKVALRGDFYENANDSINPQVGFVWKPATDWLIRAAYSTSFRPPSLLEQFSPASEFPLPIADSRRGGSVSLGKWVVGGNPELENVSAHSFTTGIEYRASGRPSFQFGAHYWRVTMSDRIIVPRVSDVEKLEELGRVMRLAPSEEDRSAGRPGAIQLIDASLLNHGRLETNGIDLEISYLVASELGRLKAGLSATWVDEYISRELTSKQEFDRVGIASLDGTVPEWRLVGGLNWEALVWGASTTITFTPSYRDAGLSGVLNRRLRSRTVVDMQAWLVLGGSDALDGWRLTAGARNIFDQDADFANVGLQLGFDVSQADLRKRFVYLRINKKF